MESGRDKKKKTSERNSIVKGTLHCEPKKKMRYSEAGTPRKTTEIFEREKKITDLEEIRGSEGTSRM